MAYTNSRASQRSQIFFNPLSAAMVRARRAARASAWSGLPSLEIQIHDNAGERFGCCKTRERQNLLVFHDASILMMVRSGPVGSEMLPIVEMKDLTEYFPDVVGVNTAESS
ncbi:hypothetical protein CDL15_Pgr025784 [Punica granatum]|uniref:Uncharacterized protein n=1 Tax=Punica granatum TaxID=22663 RepID=A0A218WAW9_PUNGR|nr:hypothetical protein CDL15_Pgr025784 [Punica granatum]